MLKNPKYESFVSYGDRYILENPDDLLKKYQEATNYKISELVVMDLRNQYFEAEYQNDALELMKYKKLSRIEPFPSLTVGEVAAMEWLDVNEKIRKTYYSSWVSQLNNEKIVFLSEEQLNEDFKKYIINLNIEVDVEPRTEVRD